MDQAIQNRINLYALVIRNGFDDYFPDGVTNAVIGFITLALEHGAASSINANQIFSSSALRDSYFTNNLSELQRGTPIIVNFGTSNAPDLRYQTWAAETPSSYNDSSWTTQISSADLEIVQGLRDMSDNAIPMRSGDTMADSPMTVSGDRILSTMSLEVPAGTIYVGTNISISAAVRALNVRDELFDRRGLFLSQVYEDDGTNSAPRFGFAPISNLVVNSGNNLTRDTAQFTMGASNAFEIIRRFMITTDTISGEVSTEIFMRTTSHTGDLIYQLNTMMATDASGVMAVELDNPLFLDDTFDVYVTINCEGMLGSLNTDGDFVPQSSLDIHVITIEEIATEPYVDQQLEGITDAFEASGEITGFESLSGSTISVDNATRVFTLGVTGTVPYWIKGVKYELTADVTLTLPDTEGMRYIYLDENGALNHTGTFSYTQFLRDNVYVASLYWDATNDQIIHLGEERHGVTMDWATVEFLHETMGAQFVSGLALGSFAIDDGAENEDAQFGYMAGRIRYEDIAFDIAIDAAPAEIPIFYKIGATPVIRMKAANAFPLIGKDDVTATDRPKYNLNTTGTWSLAEVPASNYFLMHYFATNDIDHAVIGWAGTGIFSTLTAARNAAETEINEIAGIPFAEVIPIGTVIFQTNAYANTPNARVVEYASGSPYIDFRAGATWSGSVNPSEHNNLTGRDAANAHPASAITNFPNEVVDGIESRTGDERLNYNVLRNLPTQVRETFALVGSLTSPQDNDWRVNVSGSSLTFERYRAADGGWTTVSTLGSIQTDRFIMDDQFGVLAYINQSNASQDPLIRPNPTVAGAQLNSAEGRLTMISNGEAQYVHAVGSSEVYAFQSDGTSTASGTEFRYSAPLDVSSEITTVTFFSTIQDVNYNAYLLDPDDNVLGFAFSIVDFQDGNGGTTVLGQNNARLQTCAFYETGRDLTVLLQFSSSVTLTSDSSDNPRIQLRRIRANSVDADKLFKEFDTAQTFINPTFVAAHSTDSDIVYGGFAQTGQIRRRVLSTGADTYFQSSATTPITDSSNWTDWTNRQTLTYS
ncbi:hypothetical protein OAH77_04335 [Flavobacteriaceae bacterium]|nr:hypothetical protein [Flavobacteriaceae bacterium]